MLTLPIAAIIDYFKSPINLFPTGRRPVSYQYFTPANGSSLNKSENHNPRTNPFIWHRGHNKDEHWYSSEYNCKYICTLSVLSFELVLDLTALFARIVTLEKEYFFIWLVGFSKTWPKWSIGHCKCEKKSGLSITSKIYNIFLRKCLKECNQP